MAELTSTSTIQNLPNGETVITTVTRVPGRSGVADAAAFERCAQRQVNALGCQIMQAALKHLDTEGEPIALGKLTLTSKGRQNETYQCSFGPINLERHVYQGAQGGATFVPLEQRARIFGNATALWAEVLAAKVAESPVGIIARDLASHHGRDVSPSYISKVAGDVARVMAQKEAHWTLLPQTPEEQVEAIALGIDGTCVHEIEAGWKLAMASTFTLLDERGEPLETIYLANAPEEGKATMFARVSAKVAELKAHYPNALWVGVSDGAPDLREFLERHCQQLVLDYYHAAEYVSAAAGAMVERPEQASAWGRDARERLRTEPGAAAALAGEMEARQAQLSKREKSGREVPGAETRQKLADAIRYIRHNEDRMDYAEAKAAGLPIGSGATEAACKTIVKGRLVRGGMRWHREAMQQVLLLRALHRSSTLWGQFWARLAKDGC
jgi:hypothetical protein